MNPQALILTPIRYGWAIDLTGGTRIAQFAVQARCSVRSAASRS